MHTKDSAAINMTAERINLVATWKDSHCYSEREKLALEWAEYNTKIFLSEKTDVLFNNMQKEFDDEQIVDLTIVINAINAWNRFGISFKSESGVYQPGDFDI